MNTKYNDTICTVIAIDTVGERFLIISSGQYSWVDISECEPVLVD